MVTKLRLIDGDRVARTVKGNVTRNAPCPEPPPVPPTCCGISAQNTTLYADITGGRWDGERVPLVTTNLFTKFVWRGSTTLRNCGVQPTDDRAVTIQVECNVASSAWIVTVTVAADCQAAESPMTIAWNANQCNCTPGDVNCTPGTKDCPALLTNLLFTLSGSDCATNCGGFFYIDIHCNPGECYNCQDAIDLTEVVPNIEVDLGEATFDPNCFDVPEDCCDQIAGQYTLSANPARYCCWNVVELKNCTPPTNPKAIHIAVCGPVQINSDTWRVTATVDFGVVSIEGCSTNGTYSIDFHDVLPDCTSIFNGLTLQLDSQRFDQECLLPPTLTINTAGARQEWKVFYTSIYASILAIIDTSSDVVQDHAVFSQSIAASLTVQLDGAHTHSSFDQIIFASSIPVDVSGLVMQTHSVFDQDLIADASKNYTGAQTQSSFDQSVSSSVIAFLTSNITQNHGDFDQGVTAQSTTIRNSNASQNHVIFDQDLVAVVTPTVEGDSIQDHVSFDQSGFIINEAIIYGNPLWQTFSQSASSSSEPKADVTSHHRTRSQSIDAGVTDAQGDVAQTQATFEQEGSGEGETILYSGNPTYHSISQDVAVSGSLFNSDAAQNHSTFSQALSSITERAGDAAQTHSIFDQDASVDIASDGTITQNHGVFDQDLVADLEVHAYSNQTHAIFSQDLVADRVEITLGAAIAQTFSMYSHDGTAELEFRVNGDSLYANHSQSLTAERQVQGDVAQTYSSFSQLGGATTLALSTANSDVAQTHSSFDQSTDTVIEVAGDVAQSYTTFNQDLTALVHVQGDISQLHSTFEQAAQAVVFSVSDVAQDHTTFDQDLSAVAGCSVHLCVYECNAVEGDWFQIADNCFAAICECGPIPSVEICTPARYGDVINVDCVEF